ncbi:MAG: DUF3422 domain-containing protein [Nitratireductor sp.]|nr:DUF3422 domain-containing protein [Nitratireductor sp.]
MGEGEALREATSAGAGKRYHHQYRDAVGEIHSRPLLRVPADSTVIHYAFMAEGGSSVSKAVLAEICRLSGAPAPDANARFCTVPVSGGQLSWESHSEFSTFTFTAKAPRKAATLPARHPFGSDFSQPGSIIAACTVDIRKLTPTTRKLVGQFDPHATCASVLEDGKSLLVTDFRQNAEGFTQYLLLDAGLIENRIGYYTKLAIEIETYRTLALLGLPLARTLSAHLSRSEHELERLTRAVREGPQEDNEKLLSEINDLAADIEVDSAASLFRFGASRAYGSIVQDRLESLGDVSYPGYMRISRFVNRSLLPALRTCESIENRQANLSRKLARIANLLRTRVEVEIENQNRNVLASMDRRARLQLRLQQTVEGLSVAAVSYYVVGLFYYLIQAIEPVMPFPVSPKVAAGLFVPVAIGLVWLIVRQIRRHHSE